MDWRWPTEETKKRKKKKKGTNWITCLINKGLQFKSIQDKVADQTIPLCLAALKGKTNIFTRSCSI